MSKRKAEENVNVLLKKKKGNDLSSLLTTLLPSLVQYRRHFHANPEVGFKEFETQKKLREILSGIGITNIKDSAGTGLVADIVGEGPEVPLSPAAVQAVALRSDIDCLPMTEESGVPHASQNVGFMHACGHDGHMATLIGAAKLLFDSRQRIPKGRIVRLLFQPAEEGLENSGGAIVMVKEGCLDGIDEVYGQHNWPGEPLGKIAVKAGPVMAHVSDLYITIRGKGGHGSQPQIATDPILVAGHVITAIHSIISRNIHYKESAVISICTVHGGTAANIIPDEVKLSGTIRDLKPDVFEEIKRRIQETVEYTCIAFGATGQVEIISNYPALVNTPAEAEHVRRVATSVVGEDNVTDDNLPLLAAEDFAYYTQVKPGAFFFVGSATRGVSESPPCHSALFDFNDDAIPIGVEMFLRIVEDRFAVCLFD